MRPSDSALPAPDWRRGARRSPLWRLRAWIGALALCWLGCSADPLPPNLVLLIGDDHGYPDFGFMGSERVKTPRLDALAREGVVFPLGHSTSSLCRPALRTLLTGLEPVQYRRFERDLAPRGARAAESVVRALDTLPRRLAERGYASFQAGKYFEGHFTAAGFDAGMVEHPGEEGLREASRLVRETLDPVLEFVDAHQDRPFFLWFAPKLPHLPHDPPERFLAPYRELDLSEEERGYYASIGWFDDGVGRLLDHLDARGLRERTLVVYLADNGWDPSPGLRALGGPKAKKSLHELGFRTPIVLRWPGRLAPARFDAALISIADLFPTLLEAGGAELPPGRIGVSLWPLLDGRAGPPRQELVGWTHAIRKLPGSRTRGGSFWRGPRWRVLLPQGRPAELYDVQSDPFETRDLADAHPELVAEGVRAIRDWERSLPRIEPRKREPEANH